MLKPAHIGRTVDLLFAMLMLHAGAARASDFWDRVRDPARGAYDRLVKRAEAALADNDPMAAARHAKVAVAQLPDSATAHRVLGQALLQLDLFGAASDAFAAALARDASALDGHRAQLAQSAGIAAMRGGRYELAARIQQRLATHLPPGEDRRRVFARLGDALLCLGPQRLEQARWAYAHALAGAERDDIDLYLGAALATLREGQERDAMLALSELRTAVRLERALHNRVLPEAERLARLAIGLEAIADNRGAANAWAAAAARGGPWQTFHAARASQLNEMGVAR
ncbi:MAG: hypothetical protein OXU20_06405 [Myxococcales bacterium]|nr:hypothetical protein [Myxococcales bacterium]MDD9971656.1 hypothetical protein [Myxococcales bacterium]